MPAMIASEPKAAASQNFRAPGPFIWAAPADGGNFSTLPRASTGDASELTSIIVSRIGAGANGASQSAFANRSPKALVALLSHRPNGAKAY